MLGKLFGGSDPVKSFWDWFVKNESKVAEVRTGQEPIILQIAKKLKSIHPGLVFQGGKTSDGRNELTISADGNREIFPIVEGVVAAAPRLPQWEIIAFRQPLPDVETININDISVSKNQIYFRAEVDGDKHAIELFIDGFTEEKRQEYSHAAFMLLDTTIGEYAMEERLSYIDFEALASYSGGEPLKPLAELPELLGVKVPG